MRFRHIIRHNASVETPRHLLFVDTESSWQDHPSIPAAQSHRLRLGVAGYVRFDGGQFQAHQSRSFTEAEDFWRIVDEHAKPKQSLWIFAHNVGFDMTLLRLWERIESGEIELCDPRWQLRALHGSEATGQRFWRGLLVLEDPPTIIHCRRSGAILKIVDTLNYWRMSLAKLAASVGLRKYDMPAPTASADDWLMYCTQDVTIIRHAVCQLLQWWKAGRRGNWGVTASGLAWNAYRHKYMQTPIFVHADKEALQLERAGYFGGRVLNRWSGRFSPGLACYDCNSLYPFVMSSYVYPHKLTHKTVGLATGALSGLGKDLCIVAECRVKPQEYEYPYRKDGRTHYARGDYWTVLTGPELSRADANGELADVGLVCYYEAADLFSSYVREYYEMKLERRRIGDECGEHFAKMMLNSLYGRFGRKANRWEDEPGERSPIPFGQWWKKTGLDAPPQLYRSIGWHTQRAGMPGEGRESFPAIAAHVTAYARCYMDRVIKAIGRTNVMYSDTDSLHVTPDGEDLLRRGGFISAETLGSFRREWGFLQVTYHGQKDYLIGDKPVIAGLRGRNHHIGEREYEVDVFDRLPGVITTQPAGTVTVRTERIKFAESHYDGTLTAAGVIAPLIITEDYHAFKTRVYG